MDILLDREELIFDVAMESSLREFDSLNASITANYVLLYYTEAFDFKAAVNKVKDKICELLKKIKKAIKDFIASAKVAIETKIKQIQLNSKLKELKDMLAKKKAKAVSSRFNIVDIRKYKSYYRKYINEYSAELIKGLNKKFDSIEDFNNWQDLMKNKLAEFDFILSDKEKWQLTTTVNAAVQLSEEEIATRNNTMKMIDGDETKLIKELETFYGKPTNGSHLNYDTIDMEYFTSQHAFVGFICAKVQSITKKVINFCIKHPIAAVTSLLFILIAL